MISNFPGGWRGGGGSQPATKIRAIQIFWFSIIGSSTFLDWVTHPYYNIPLPFSLMIHDPIIGEAHSKLFCMVNVQCMKFLSSAIMKLYTSSGPIEEGSGGI